MPTYSDINSQFTTNPFSGDVTASYDTAAINNSIRNLVFGRRFERPFLEYLNCGVEQELFELVNAISANNIQTRITDILTQFEPRINTVTVNVQPSTDGYGYEVTIVYLPRNSLQVQTINLFLQRII